MVTMQQIADRAGVSRCTVSFVLNGTRMADKIPKCTHRKILSAAEKLGYQPNELAQALISGNNKVVAFLTSTGNGDYFAPILRGAMNAIDENDYYLKCFSVSTPETWKLVRDKLLKQQVSSVILQGLKRAAAEWFHQELLKHGIRCCFLCCGDSPETSFRVSSDDQSGAASAVRYLERKGHRKLLFLKGQSVDADFSNLQHGVELGARECKVELTVSTIESCWPGGQAYYDADLIRKDIVSIIEKHRGTISAVFCADEMMGVLAIQACNRLGIHVPVDLSIMGYSTSRLSQCCDPELTTVSQPHFEMGYQAASSLVEALRKDRSGLVERGAELKLPGNINPGASVAHA